MSLFTSSLPVLRNSSCCRHKAFSQNLFTGRHKSKPFRKWKSKGSGYKGLIVTGASAAACTFVYLSLKSHNLDDIQNVFRVDKENSDPLSSFKCCKSKDIDSLDLFYVGYVEDWLAFQPSIHISQSRTVYESNAFIKQNISELLSPWEQARSDDPWVLLQLTKSKNFWVRQMGVACLADKINWEAYKYTNVAQACDYRTVIALARYPQASDAYFLPQPKLWQTETDVVAEIQNLVRKMPVPLSVQSHIAFYRDFALQKETDFQLDPWSMDLLTHFYTLPGEEEKKKNQSLRYCLQALEAYTVEEAYALCFINLHGLAVLQRLKEDMKEDWIQTYILIILNNLSQVSEIGRDLVCTGWVNELRKWSKGKNSTFSIMADTILANLDRDWITSDLYRNIILLHPTPRNSQPVYADIVLVHGLRGSAVRTWRQRDKERKDKDYSYCWPKDWLSCEFQGARIVSVGYSSSMHKWGDQYPYEEERRTLEGRSSEIIRHLVNAGIGTRPIIWMGHSMGGLLIKEILRQSGKNPNLFKIVDNTKGIVMYSVPHKGSPVVDTMMNAKYILFPSVEVQEMSTYSLKLRKLHEEFVRMVSNYNIPFLSFGENVKTDFGKPFPSFWLVPKESSDPGIGSYVGLAANHFESCKPSDKNDLIYTCTLEFLQDILKNLD